MRPWRTSLSDRLDGASGKKKATAGKSGKVVSWGESLLTAPVWLEGGAQLHKTLDGWMESPPPDCAIVALSLSPDRSGLLISRWTDGCPPIVAHVLDPPADEKPSASGADPMAELLAELEALINQSRSALGQEGAGRSSATREVAPSAAAASSSSSAAAGSTTSGFVARLVPEVKGFAPIVLDRTTQSVCLGRTQKGVGKVDHDQISGSHCTLSLDADSGELMLTDTSTNGTFMDGRIVPKKQKHKPTPLRPGSSLSLVAKNAADSLKRFDGLLPAYTVEVVEGGASPDTVAPMETETQPPVTHEARAAHWTRREEFDTRLGVLSERIQARLLAHAACLLVPPAKSAAHRNALERLGELAMARCGKSAWCVDSGLLRAACAALPCLAEAELKHAVSAAAVTKDGQPLPESDLMDLVAELRKAWRQVSLDAESTLPGGGTDRAPLILLVDATLGRLPWESIPLLRDVAVCRLPSAAFVSTSMSAARRLMRVDDRNKPAPTTSKAKGKSKAAATDAGARSGNAYYVLNPAGDLTRTQQTFEESFASQPWEGVTGQPPPMETLSSALRSKDLYVYCGHGDGSRYLPAESLQRLPACAAAFLMGCSSGALRTHGGLAPSGMALAYLHAGCPALVANLWDVTDGEIDRFCAALIEHTTKSGGSLLDSVAKARTACRLRFLTGAAAVTYGVPLEFLPATERS